MPSSTKDSETAELPPKTDSASRTAPESYAELHARITEISDELPKRLLQSARYMINHPDRIALCTTAEIAEAAEVQPSTLVRFAQTLGFSGFSEMQRLFKDHLVARDSAYHDRLKQLNTKSDNSAASLLSAFASASQHSLSQLSQTAESDSFLRAIKLLAQADTVYLLGLRRSFPIVNYLYYMFGKMNRRCVLLDHAGGILLDKAKELTEKDVLFASTFYPYSGEVIEFATQISDKNIPVITLSDTVLTPIPQFSTEILKVQEAEIQSFRTLSVSMCLVAALAVAVGNELTNFE